MSRMFAMAIVAVAAIQAQPAFAFDKSRLCARLDTPGETIRLAHTYQYVRRTDGNRLVVNEAVWFGQIGRRERLGLLLSYACSSDRDTVRAVSDRDGRKLAVCTRGACFETRD